MSEIQAPIPIETADTIPRQPYEGVHDEAIPHLTNHFCSWCYVT